MTIRASRRRRYLLPALVVLAALALATAFGIDRATHDAKAGAQSVGAYSILQVSGDEVESYESLTSMARGADTVLVGRITAFGVGRTVQGDHSQDAIVYGAATVQVLRQVAGKPAGSSLEVEFLLPYGEAEAPARAAEFNAALPHAQSLFFLRAKRGVGEAGKYRLVNSTGLWTSTARAALDTPLAEEAPKDGRYTTEIKQLTSVDELADKITKG